ncbi:hypothetical protein [Frankia sp. Cj5]|uniref:hypothetical protein n=1 Tax=Frankia sp. Cj5 TaxID=2880978 RepID=UPI001EF6BB91|nr:hypothetical protein [Frankia sp. Cj5]
MPTAPDPTRAAPPPGPSPSGRQVRDPDLPALMRSLPIDPRRRLPIPAVTAHHPNGDLDFTTVDGATALRLASEGRCTICGKPFHGPVAFLGGVGAAVVGVYFDPPMHPVISTPGL